MPVSRNHKHNYLIVNNLVYKTVFLSDSAAPFDRFYHPQEDVAFLYPNKVFV